MKSKLEKHRQYLFLGITLIALGVTLSTVFRNAESSIGVIFIAIGGLFFIIGMSMKKKTENNNAAEQ